MDLIDFKTTFDGILATYIDEKLDECKALLADGRLKKFVDHIDTFIFSGGKRIRPYCARAVYMWLWGKQEKAMLQFSMFFEIFHSFALVHDDIMDQADKRHNQPSVHNYVQTFLGTDPNAIHTWASQAILIGDLLCAWAYGLLNKEYPFPEEFLKKAKINIQEMIEEVIVGQMIDIDLSVSAPAALEIIDKKNMYKTASYTFIRPMLTGAILAGADEATQKQVAELGKNLGLAFQIRDDLFDLIGRDKTKSMFADIQEWQQTYFTHYVFSKGSDEEKSLLKECLWKKLTKEQVTQLKTMFETSGAINRWREAIAGYIANAKKIFDEIEIFDAGVRQGFDVLIRKLERTA